MAEQLLKWFPMFPADFLLAPEVLVMTPAQRGIYIFLLCNQWKAGGNLPTDPRFIAALAGCTSLEVFKELGGEFVLEFFTPSEDGKTMANPRLTKELSKQLGVHADTTEQRREAGKRSAAKRAAKAVPESNENPTTVERPLNETATTVERALNENSTSVERPLNENPTSVERAFNEIQQSRVEKSKEALSSGATPPPKEYTRHHKCRLAIEEACNAQQVPFVWDGRDAKALTDLLASAPSLSLEGFKKCLSNRFHSQDTALSDRPAAWLSRLPRYFSGPLDKYGKPLADSSGPAPRRALKPEDCR